MHYGDFVSGRLDDSGMVQQHPNWISTPELIAVPDSMFWLYFLIRPVHWLWWKLTGKDRH